MIYRFVLISGEVKDFRRDLRIASNSTFLDLHDAITRDLGYDPGEPSLFRLTDDQWNPETDVYQYDMGFADSDEEVRLMKETYLDDFLESEKQRLLFTFDLVGNRSLYLELREIVRGEELKMPEIVRSAGDPPRQTTPIEDLLKAETPVTAVSGAASEDYGFGLDGGYNEEDLSDLDITTEDDL